MTLEKRGVEGLTVQGLKVESREFESREAEKSVGHKARTQTSDFNRFLTRSSEAEGGREHTPRIEQRVKDLALHISWFGFKTQVRLAQDSGVSPAAISRLIRGQSQPSLALALRVTAALSRRAGRDLDVREVFSLDGTYPTPACALMGCRACLPTEAYDEDDNLKPTYRKPSGRAVPSNPQREGGV
jgi:DNA-binding XRE family transcriptional regulator